MNYKNQSVEKWIIIILTILFLLLSIFLLKDVFILLAYSFLLSYYLIPIKNFFIKQKVDKSLSSIIALLSFIVLILVPFFLFIYYLLMYSLNLVSQYKGFLKNPNLLNNLFSSYLNKYLGISINLDFTKIFAEAIKMGINGIVNLFYSIPFLLINFFVILFISYYILIDTNSLKKIVYNGLVAKEKVDFILNSIIKNMNRLFVGYVFTGLIQTFVASIGYLIFGVPDIFLMSFLTFIFSLIPYVGTAAVWVPLSLYLIIIGFKVKGILLFLYGIALVSSIDNFIRPYLMSGEGNLTPPVVFLGFLGGLTFLGLPGIILGPIILTTTLDLLKLIYKDFRNKTP